MCRGNAPASRYEAQAFEVQTIFIQVPVFFAALVCWAYSGRGVMVATAGGLIVASQVVHCIIVQVPTAVFAPDPE